VPSDSFRERLGIRPQGCLGDVSGKFRGFGWGSVGLFSYAPSLMAIRGHPDNSLK